jgi:GNAT superfamily N-acetyltransferase
MSLPVTSEPDAPVEDVEAVRTGLLAFNESHAGPANPVAVQIFARDENGKVVGGLLGGHRWGWLYVDKLWVRDDLRGQGIGTRLLKQAEEEARSLGCTTSVLDTFAFQARPFYEKLGYRVYATLEGFPPGYCMYFLRKELTNRADEDTKRSQ